MEMARKTEEIKTRVVPEQRQRLETIARERYDGNLSMATRRLLDLGLKQLERESEASLQLAS